MIVGNGMVGQRLCERMVELGAGSRYEIVVIGEERTPAYDRVHLTDIWRGRSPDELQLRDVAWYGEHGIELRLGERVERIDREAHEVVTSSGGTIAYDKLVLATGSRAMSLRVTQSEGANLLSYRTLDDARRIFEEARSHRDVGRPVAVIGAGLLGLEAARSLQQLGCSVVVLEAASQVLPRQLDPEAAAELASILTEAGIELRLRAQVSAVHATEGGVRIELTGEPPIDACFVVSAVGAKARDEIAREAALRCHMRGGVTVDNTLRTSDPRIFAVGECASFDGVPHGLVAPGYAMADVLAENLMGRRSRLGPQEAVTRLKLDLTEVTVLGNPLATSSERDLVFRSKGVYRRLVSKKGRVVAAICVGAWADLPGLQQAVTQGRKLTRAHFERFEREGLLGLASDSAAIGEWPDAAVVCQCANVSCGALRACLRAGAKTVDDLARATSASTLCGSCRPLLGALVGAPASAVAPPAVGRTLGVAAALAALLAIATLCVPAIPAATSVLEHGLDLLWFDPFWKQVTGFSLLGLTLVGLLLSARKRIRRFSFGGYSFWRALHALLGVGGLIALFAHTGFRLGSHLNFALAVAFIASAFTGAASGALVTLAARQPSGRFRDLAAWSKRLHDLAFWPLPTLIAFHLLKTYYY